MVGARALTPCAWALALAPALAQEAPDEAARDARLPPARDGRLERAVTLDDEHPFEPPADLDAWRARRERVRRQVLVAAGLWPMPARTPLNAVVRETARRAGYAVDAVRFESYPGFFVTGNLYRPLPRGAGRVPGVLCPHGHWNGGRFSERSDDEARAEIEAGAESELANAKYHLQARCAQLARMGCVVLHYDMVGYADSSQLPHAEGFGDLESELALLSAFGLQTWSSIRALDFLASLPEVDPERIGVTGASGGGTQTFVLCAVDDRPAAAFPAVMVSTAMQGGCACENASHLRVGTGNVELAALFAPRPLFLTGADDWTIEIETQGLPELQRVYELYGAAGNVAAKCFPEFQHNYNRVARELMYAWFDGHLGLGHAEPIREARLDPIPPPSSLLAASELSVFDAEHPRPEGALDAGGVRRAMRAAAEEAVAGAWPRTREELESSFRRVFGGALEALLHTSLPEAEELEVETGPEVEWPGGSRRELVLARRGSGEAVDASLVVPEAWNGGVLVAVSSAPASAFDGASPHALDPAPILERGWAWLEPRVLLVDRPGARLPVDSRHDRFVGYTLGYNRTLIAERVHDVLTAVGYAHGLEGAREVRLFGSGEAGAWVLLAGAIAGGALGRTAAEWRGDLLAVERLDDPSFLPGAEKYGGLPVLAGLGAPRPLALFGTSDPPARLLELYDVAGARAALRAFDAPGAALVEWISAPPR